MQPTENNTEYTVSIRLVFPEAISKVIKQEKDRFVSEYGSSYKSEPHITLYLGRYTQEGFPKLIQDLRELPLKRFTIFLLDPKVVFEKGLHRNLYVVDVSNKEQLRELHVEVLNVAVRYKSSLLREKEQKRLAQGLYSNPEFDPHITLGEIGLDDPQPELADVQKNLKEIVGEKVTVSNLAVFFHKREYGEEKAKLVEEVTIPFRS